MYVVAGPMPAEEIQQYLAVVGKPTMGLHYCRWGYPNVSYVTEVVAHYSVGKIPLETQWVDIDYMDAYLHFSLDPGKWPD